MAKGTAGDEKSLSGFEKERVFKRLRPLQSNPSCAVSVMANIAEGNGRRTNNDFASFLVQAHGSAAEVQSHLYLALDLEYLNQADFYEIFGLYDEISRMSMALAQHLRKAQQNRHTQ